MALNPIGANNQSLLNFVTRQVKNDNLQAQNGAENKAANLKKAAQAEAAKNAIKAKIAELQGDSPLRAANQGTAALSAWPGYLSTKLHPDIAAEYKPDIISDPKRVPEPYTGELKEASAVSFDPDAITAKRSQAILDQMITLANRAANYNYVGEDRRAEVAAEFNNLAEQLGKAFEIEGLTEGASADRVNKYLASLDITTRAGAADVYHKLQGVQGFVDSRTGNDSSPPPPTTKHGALLRDLQDIANRAAGHTTADQRAALNKEFQVKLEQYVKMINNIDNTLGDGALGDVSMNFLTNYIQSFDVSTEEGADFAFNNLMNLESFMDTHFV